MEQFVDKCLETVASIINLNETSQKRIAYIEQNQRKDFWKSQQNYIVVENVYLLYFLSVLTLLFCSHVPTLRGLCGSNKGINLKCKQHNSVCSF